MPERLEEISNSMRETERLCEYDFLIQTSKMLNYIDIPLLLQEVNVLSGYSLRFLYRYDFPEVYNADIDFILKNLKKNVGADFKVFDLHRESDSLVMVKNFIEKGLPVLIYPENLLLYQLEEKKVRFFRLFFIESEDIDEIITRNTKAITILEPHALSRDEVYRKDTYKVIIDNFVELFYRGTEEINSTMVYEGREAYSKFIEDLRNDERSFEEKSKMWFSVAPYAQWTSLNGLLTYFLGVFHFLEKQKQKIGLGIIRSFDDTITNWKDWGRFVGRDAHMSHGKTVSMEARRNAANSLERALKILEDIALKIKYLY